MKVRMNDFVSFLLFLLFLLIIISHVTLSLIIINCDKDTYESIEEIIDSETMIQGGFGGY